MDYALAKALRDAGFPQAGRGTRVPQPDKIVARRDDYAYVSTLEELIEACGNDMFGALLNESDGTWLAEPHMYAAVGCETTLKQAEGSTPSEAVGRLWLALNSK